MSVIQLESPSGTPLNIKEGSTAKLTFDIPNSHQNEAPDEIPLWYLDEDTGYWIEDGFAIKMGTTYVGEVSHFSFWNCDFDRNAFIVSFRLVDTVGQPLSNTPVRLITSDGLVSNTVFTDSNGYASGLAPGFVDLSLNLVAYDCQFEQLLEIGSLVGHTNLNDIVIELENAAIGVINAQIVDCNNIPLANMEVAVFTRLTTIGGYAYHQLISDEQGRISFVSG